MQTHPNVNYNHSVTNEDGTVSKPHEINLPPSMHIPWKTWKRVSDNQTNPRSIQELNELNFWYYPKLYNQRNGGIKWHAPCWLAMMEGSSTIPPVQTVGDLKALQTRGAPLAWQAAATRLQSEFPAEWKPLPMTCPSHDQKILIKGNQSEQSIPLESKNKTLYTNLVQDEIRKSKKQDLLLTLKNICKKYNINIDEFNDEDIWQSIFEKEIDYAMFSDLYWRLILGKLQTGEALMLKVNALNVGWYKQHNICFGTAKLLKKGVERS